MKNHNKKYLILSGIISISALIWIAWVFTLYAAPPDIRVGLILSKNPQEIGADNFLYNSAGVMKREMLNRRKQVEISYAQEAYQNQATVAANMFGEGSYDLVVLSDEIYCDAAEAAAGRYAETIYIVIGDCEEKENEKNLATLHFRYDELGEAAGQVMARRSNSGKLLYMTGDGKNRRNQLIVAGLKRGIKSVNPDAQLNVVRDVQDSGSAMRILERAMDKGVDVINLDLPRQTLLDAYRVIQQRGKHASNWNLDLSPLYPETTLGSYNPDVASVMAWTIVELDNDRLAGKRYSLGLGQNALNITPIYNLPDSEIQAVHEAIQKTHDRGWRE